MIIINCIVNVNKKYEIPINSLTQVDYQTKFIVIPKMPHMFQSSKYFKWKNYWP
jgi:hypothetical protein